MTRFRIVVEYDGRSFMGWQRQAHGPSVQQAIEEAAALVTGEKAIVQAAGRTDAGVHAIAMTAQIDIAKPITCFRLSEALNARLRPQPVAILSCAEEKPEWHARFSCIGRHYRYRILNRRAPPALEAGRAWQVAAVLDSDAMDDAAQVLVGRHDFTTFRSAHCQAESPIRTLDYLRVRRDGALIMVETGARSFLHHQVRSMVGCLELVGRGKWNRQDLEGALAARDRAALGYNAPPDGLYFVAADYPAEG